MSRWVFSLLGVGWLLSACAGLPQPITDSDVNLYAKTVRAEISAHQDPISQPISLYEAIARALKYNLSHRVSMMEMDLARADYDLSRYDRLPNVVANGGYYGRSNQSGSSSLSLISGRQSLEPSTATEKTIWTGDLTTSWNVLDFGLSKVRSEQIADDILIYEERRRKVIANIIEDVHRAYWKAVSFERLKGGLSALRNDVDKAIHDSQALYAARKTAPLKALIYQRELNDVQAQLQRLSRDLKAAKFELSELMGVLPDQAFTLVEQESGPMPEKFEMDFEAMIHVALRQRPEIRETIYAQRVGEREMKKAVLEALPSIEGFAGLDISSNSFLFHSNWADYGARASWNLLKVFSIGTRKRQARARAALEEQRALAAGLAVITQLGTSYVHYESIRKEYLTVDHGAQLQSEILQKLDMMNRVGTVSRQELIRERMNTLLSDLRRDILFAEMNSALAHIYTALGFDPYGTDIRGDEDIQTLTASLKRLWESRNGLPVL